MDLDQLFTHYGSDKTVNGYAPIYHALFKHIKDRPINLLEIGIGTMIPHVHSSMVGYALNGYKPGGSLRAWRDYFTRGMIYGADVQPDTQFTDEDRIKTILCDSTSGEVVELFLLEKQFDIIVDDGSHNDQDQLKTLSLLYCLLNKGGYYIVEDVTRNSRMAGVFHSKIKEIIGNDLFYMNDNKNLLIISKRL